LVVVVVVVVVVAQCRKSSRALEDLCTWVHAAFMQCASSPVFDAPSGLSANAPPPQAPERSATGRRRADSKPAAARPVRIPAAWAVQMVDGLCAAESSGR